MAITHMKPQLAGIPTPSLGVAWPVFFMLLALMIGFRHEVGADWGAYLFHVEDMQGEELQAVLSKADPAYELLNWLGANIGGGVYFVNFVCACLFCWGLIAFCRAQPRPWLALFVATPYLITVVAMGYTRQGVALGLAMLALTKLLNHSVIRFGFWITLAALFHTSAVILVPFALFAGSKHRVLLIGGVGISAALLFALLLQEHLGYFHQNYIEAEYASSGAAIRIAMNAIPAAVFIIFNKSFSIDSKNRGLWLWMAWSALLFVPVLVVSPSSTAVDRVALYWIPLQLVIFSRLPDAFGVVGRRNQLWIYLLVAYSATIMFAWLFFADNAHAWLPYRFYPWEAFWI